jgi:hypothetical protein
MAAVLTRPPLPASKEEKRFTVLFRRQIAPRLKDLGAERQRLRQRYLLILAGFGGLLGVDVALLWQVGLPLVVVSVIGLGALGWFLLRQLERRFHDQLRAAVMPALCEAIGDLEHAVGGAPGLDFHALERLGLLPRHNRRKVDDVFVGRHRDTGFIMAEATLRQRSRGRRGGSRTRFRGLILAIATPHEIAARILIAKDVGLVGNQVIGWLRSCQGLERILLPHPGFERHFELYADQAEVALRTVTPDLCDALVALAEAHDGQPLQAAFLGRHFYLAMPRPGDQFRLGTLFRPLDRLEADAGRVLHDIQIVHRVIDTLHGIRRDMRADRRACPMTPAPPAR